MLKYPYCEEKSKTEKERGRPRKKADISKEAMNTFYDVEIMQPIIELLKKL